MNIREFIKLTVEDHNKRLSAMPASQVLLQKVNGIEWPEEFERQGFTPIIVPSRINDNDICEWCKNTFGEDHYVAFYTSTKRTYTFWFDRPQNATLFRIKWSQ